jgi:hypothetical protein
MGHLLFVWTPKGYELQERDGDMPSVGSEVEQDGKTLRITKIAPSPLQLAMSSAAANPSTSACANPLA